jgi:hypothetical protein
MLFRLLIILLTLAFTGIDASTRKFFQHTNRHLFDGFFIANTFLHQFETFGAIAAFDQKIAYASIRGIAYATVF